MTRTIDKTQARRFYDAFGRKQDAQAFYEDVAVNKLLEAVDLTRTRHLVEIGCGTGRLAERLLTSVLPRDARYTGIDISDTMIRLARDRVSPFADRARLVRQDASEADIPADADALISCYVLDILSEADIRALLDRIADATGPPCRLGLVSLTPGDSPMTRAISSAWSLIHRLRPLTVGGCRPLRLAPLIDPARWSIQHHSLTRAFGLCSEIIVADRIGPERVPNPSEAAQG